MIVTSVAFYAQPVGCDFTFVFALVLGLATEESRCIFTENCWLEIIPPCFVVPPMVKLDFKVIPAGFNAPPVESL